MIAAIDPGVNTGIAIMDTSGQYIYIKSHDIIKCMGIIIQHKPTHVYIEDPNKRTWFGKAGRDQLQGAGSIKRDYSVWCTFLDHHGIPYTGVSPKSIGSSFNSELIFKAATGWNKPTSVHARDAAKIIFKYFRL